MRVRVVEVIGNEVARPIASPLEPQGDDSWLWVDIEAGRDDAQALAELARGLDLDQRAIRHVVTDRDLPRMDDFGSSVLVVLHGLAEERIKTYEIDCFLTERHLVTIRAQDSPSVEALWAEIQTRPDLTSGGPDELLARLAGVLTRRLLSILDAFDSRAEQLVTDALRTAPTLIADVTAVRRHLATLRKAIVPQREVLDLLRHSKSPLLRSSGRRRFSDIFEVASRAVAGVDAARTALAEVLEAYRGTEARNATEVTKVLTIYAAIMLPLTLVVGFFGMNFETLPGLGRDRGWILVVAAMALVTVASLGLFVSLGWMRRPSGRATGSKLGSGLGEAAKAPVHIPGAVVET